MLSQLRINHEAALTLAQAAAAKQAEARTSALQRYWSSVAQMATGQSSDSTEAITQFEADLALLGLSLADAETDVQHLVFITSRRRDAQREVRELEVASKTAGTAYEAAHRVTEQAKAEEERLLEAARVAALVAAERRKQAVEDLRLADEREAELQLRGMPVPPKAPRRMRRVRARDDITFGETFRQRAEVFLAVDDGEPLPDSVEAVGDDVPIGRSEEPRFDEIAIRIAAENKLLNETRRPATPIQVAPA
jgi:hypothetical protein